MDMLNSTIATVSTNGTHQAVNTEGGIFSGKGVLSTSLALFLVQTTIIIALCRILHFFLQKLRQPSVIAEVIGGMCLGPSILGNIPGFTDTIFPSSSLSTLTLISNIGLVLYMFLMGLELDTSIMFRGIRKFLLISLAGILLPGALGAAVSYGLYEVLLEPDERKDTPFSSFLIFTFVSMAITAFPVLARILTEKKLLGTNVGLMTISAAAVDDICAWILLALVVSIINAGSPLTALYVLLCVAAYAILLLGPVRIIIRKIFDKFLSNRSHILTPLVLAVIFIMIFLSAWMTEWIGVHAIFGAFLSGIIIPRKGRLTMELTEKLEDLIGVVFLPLYFASSGLKTKLGVLNDWKIWLFLLLVIFVACAGKIIGCTLAARFSGFKWREAFSIGILMNTKGLVELIVLNIGLDAGVINDRIFALMVLMALVTTFMTSPIIAIVYPKKYQINAQITVPKKAKRSLNMNRPDDDDRILVYLKDIDSVPVVANILQMFRASLAPGKQLFLNSLKAFTDFDRSSNMMASTQTESVIESEPSLKMFRFFGNLIGAQTKSFVTHSHLFEIGDEIDRIATNEQCDLVIVPWRQDSPSADQQEATLSILNTDNTIAIYVDLRDNLLNNIFANGSFLRDRNFHGILIPFIGGPNDRAALQLAFRFRRQTKIRLMVLHLYIPDHPSNKLDNDILQVAKDLAKEGDFSFHAVPIRENDYTPILNTLKNSPFDLIILGHTTNQSKISIEQPQNLSFIRRFWMKLQHFGRNLINSIKREDKSQHSDGKNDANNRIFTQRTTGNRGLEESEEEKIFGSIGSMIYLEPKVTSSLLVVHAAKVSSFKTSVTEA